MARWPTGRRSTLPAHKGVPGWEFTELKNFDLASFPTRAGLAGTSTHPAGVRRARGRRPRSTQVDAAWERVAAAAVARARSSCRCRRRSSSTASSSTRTSARSSPIDEIAFVARNAAEWEGGAFVYVPRNIEARRPDRRLGDPGPAGRRAELARARRARGGRRGRGVGAVRSSRRRPLHDGRRARRRAERDRCASSARRTSTRSR